MTTTTTGTRTMSSTHTPSSSSIKQASTSRTGRAVPLSAPIHSRNVKILSSLRAHQLHLERRTANLEGLQKSLRQLPDEPRWDAHVPVPSTSRLAFTKGQIVNTNTVTVNLGGGKGTDTAEGDDKDGDDGGYWVEYTAKQAIGVAERKKEAIKDKLVKVRDAIKDAESAVGAEMGFASGGGVNEKNEILNEEGLPFVDIQEFEDDDDEEGKTTDQDLQQAPRPQSFGTATAGPSTPTDTDTLDKEVSSAPETGPAIGSEAKDNLASPSVAPAPISKTASTTTSAVKAVPPPAAAAAVAASAKEPKKVSFSADVKDAQDDEDSLPVISSAAAAATAAGLPSPSATHTASTSRPSAPPAVKPAVFERPLKSTIVAKEVSRPPPKLTAAERSANKKYPSSSSSSSGPAAAAYTDALTFDGVRNPTNKGGKTIDLSAYLPKSLRGSSSAVVNGGSRHDIQGKGKERQVDEGEWGAGENNEGEGEDQGMYEDDPYEEEDGDEDSDGFYDYDDSEDEDDPDNIHIDDVLAMREAALEYHAKRYNLGAGAGTGPLGGYGRPDEFDEPSLGEAEKGGLPFRESRETEDGQRPPSRFRTGRLSTARMVIPELQPGLIDINESILPGDSLGPFEDPAEGESEGGGEDEDDAGQAAVREPETAMPLSTNDLKGMSREEIATFLKYVRALETGEDLDDMSVIPAARQEEEVAAVAADAATITPGSAGMTPANKDEDTEQGQELLGRPPAIQASITKPPSIKPIVIEKPSGGQESGPVLDNPSSASSLPYGEKSVTTLSPSSTEPAAGAGGPPKRVSRFRAAREGQA